ncbi:hypothetical protein [Nostoc sp.]|uniref:hypothetical protein n=1 Tax=Nostoc sp. TaxID=1180 RepID=UPI002FF4A50E
MLTTPSEPKRPGDLAGLGFNLADAHAAFLEKYRQKTENNLWHSLRDGGDNLTISSLDIAYLQLLNPVL